ncbi:hypothetical protein Tco_0378576 [Tanacetum coccineum]
MWITCISLGEHSLPSSTNAYQEKFLELINSDNQESKFYGEWKEQIPHPRFTKLIINHFLTKHKSIPRRLSSFNNTIKYDGVLGKMKFVSKGEDEKMYGMSIPDAMMNDAIKNFDAYQLYITLSTNTLLPKAGKGKSKGSEGKKKADPPAPKDKKVTPKKKGRITLDDNILPDPDKAYKLGKSISKTKAEFEEEHRRVRDTHERLVIKETTSEEVPDEAFDEDKEEWSLRQILTGVVIGRPT